MAKIKCKYAFDESDEYCRTCNGITMMVEGVTSDCQDCAGFEAGEEIEEDVESVEEPAEPIEEPRKEEKPKKTVKAKTTTKTEEPKKEEKPKKVQVEAKEIEAVHEVDGVKVVSLRYTSGATIKKGDNFYKFVAEEEWEIGNVDSLQDTRDMLWAQLNGEVDKQIDELSSIN